MEVLDCVRLMDTAPARLRTLMLQDDLNQQELADKIGYNFTSISKFLNEKSPISDKFLRLTQDKLGWSSHYIRTGKGAPRVPKQHDESVNTDQSGNRNQNTVNYKSTDLSVTDKLRQLEQDLQAEKMRNLVREKELLEEINKLLKGDK